MRASAALFLARDRLGIRPLFYTIHDGRLIFGSEIKAILADPGVQAELDPVALDQIFTFWSTLSPRTVFQGIVEVPPGIICSREDGMDRRSSRYWELDFTARAVPAAAPVRGVPGGIARACWSTRRASGCGPMCRWAPT